MSVFFRLGAALRTRRLTLFVWAAIILAIFAGVSYNRAAAARTRAALGSPNAQIRDHEVKGLVERGRLSDALAATQNPNENNTSVWNVESVTLRQNAADSVNRLAAAHRISDAQALDALFLLRKDANQGVKDHATAGLATLGGTVPADLSAIVSRLRDGDPDIRSAAVDALGAIGGAAAAQKIDPLLKDTAAQDAAQSALQKIGAPSVSLLLVRLSDSDVAFRQRVVGMLGQIASPQSVPALIRVAATDAPSVRRLALVALANTVLNNDNALQKAEGDARRASADPRVRPEDVQKAKNAIEKAHADLALARFAEPVLIGVVRNAEDDSEARTQSALALGHLRSAASISALAAVLGDYDARVRSAALQGLQSSGALAVEPLQAVLARGQDTSRRAAAAQALGGIGTDAAVAALRGMLADHSAPVSVRRSAVVGLGQSDSPVVIPALVASLADPDGAVANAASDALLTPALEKQAIPLLVAFFDKPSPVPFNASRTLSRMGDLPVRALTAAASSSDPAVQTWAAVTLGRTDSDDPAITAALTPLTKSAHAGVQYAATQALNRLSGA